MRPLFIGEAPSPSTSRFGSHPLVGMTGTRLAQWAGVSPAWFRRQVECVNLFDEIPQRWDRQQASEAGAAVCAANDLSGRHVVLLGRKVAEAVGVPYAPFKTHEMWWGPATTLPHPSGLNHVWNDEANVRRAERFLRHLLGTGRRARQVRLPMRSATATREAAKTA